MNQCHGGDELALAKAVLRERLLTARRARSSLDRGIAIATTAFTWELLQQAETVAAYLSVGTEPGTGELLDALLEAKKRVLLPVLLADNDLDWSLYTGRANIMQAARGLTEPIGARLGVDAIRTADMVLVPGLAASPTGTRLGRGGGSYDRALARISARTPVAVVLYDDEVGVAVPAEPHDKPVTHALTPTGVQRLAG